MENRKIKILAIDDNRDNLISLKAIIAEVIPQSVVYVELSGQGGIESARKNEPDVILLDIVMPVMDGYEVCRILKADEQLSETPVIFFTALKEDKQSRILALEVGGEAFLSKPIDSSELRAQVLAMVKIKKAATHKKDERLQLEELVQKRTEELKGANIAALNLLEDLKTENEIRKQSEEALQSLSSRQEAILEAVPDIIMEVDNDKVYRWANTEGLKFFGEDVIGREAAFYFDGEQNTYNRVQTLFNGNEDVIYIESWQRRKDGQKRLLAWWCKVLKDENKNVTGALSTARDITEQKLAEQQIIEAKEKAEKNEIELIKAQEIAHLGSWYLNVKTNEVVWTEELYKMYGFDPTMPPPPYTEHMKLFTPESWEILSTSLAKTRETGIPYELELKTITKDNSNGWMWVRGEAVLDEGNKIVGLWGAAQDITGRKLLENDLKEKNIALTKINIVAEKLSSLKPDDNFEEVITRQLKEISGAELATFSEYNPELRTISVNHIEIEPALLRKAVRLLGTSVNNVHSPVSDEMYREMTSEIIGLKKTLSEATMGAISKPVGAAIQALLKVDRFIGTAYLIDGKLFGTSLLGMSKVKPDPPRDVLLSFLHLATVSLRRLKAEKKLMASEIFLKEAQRVAHLGHWELDPKIGIPRWSAEIFQIFGIDPKEHEPSFLDHKTRLHQDDWPILDKAVTKCCKDGTPFDIQFRIVRPNGEIRWMHALGNPILDSNGGVERIFGTAQDITDSKLAELELIKSKELLSDLNKRMESVRENERVDISREIHDQLGQSLTALKIDMMNLLDKMKIESREARVLGDMIKMIDTISRDVQRISSDLRPLMLDDLGLAATLEWYCEAFAGRTGLKVELDIEATQSDSINKDLALYRVAQESLTNIARHANAAMVLVSLHTINDNLVLTIQDDGIGISRDKIGSYKSLGLMGMSERVKQYDGKLEILAPDKNGTIIRASIPIN